MSEKTLTPRFTSILVTCNDAGHLQESLSSVTFCEEVLVFDMGSKDSSYEIAREIASRVERIQQVDVVEKVWGRVVSEAGNDWLILLDPDEVFPTDIIPELKKIIQSQPDVGLISIPWKYYFLGKPLNSTSWGQEHFKARIFHRDRVDLTGVLFKGIQLKPGYSSYTFPTESGFILKHYWIDSLPQLFSKHWRYIRNDGEARYNKGERFSFKRQVKESIRTFRKDLFDYHGIKDGCRGIFLSFFHAWFIFNCHISLFFYQVFKAPKMSEPRAA